MTSITTLAHTASAPAFNGLFYATAATIIPVLFIAIAVQGSTYEAVLKNLTSQTQRLKPDTPLPEGCTTLAVMLVLFGAALLTLFYGIASEIDAVYALYQQQAESRTGQYVLTGVILLFTLTAAGPALAFLRWFLKAVFEEDEAAPQHPAASPPDGKPEPETDKPDPA